MTAAGRTIVLSLAAGVVLGLIFGLLVPVPVIGPIILWGMTLIVLGFMFDLVTLGEFAALVLDPIWRGISRPLHRVAGLARSGQEARLPARVGLAAGFIIGLGGAYLAIMGTAA